MATIWTVGHSTRSLDELAAVLQAYGIELVVDVRAQPTSRRNPQFNRASMEAGLPEKGIGYQWMGLELGGLREKPNPESPHSGLRNKPLRNYADHMDTPMFQETLQSVIEIAKARRVALLCAELHWWRCHRSMLADALTASGHEVLHIQDETTSQPHKLNAVARVAEGKVVYDAKAAQR